MSDDDTKAHAKRDAETLIALGMFMVVLSIPVLIGTIYAETTYAKVVNVVSALILMAIGGGFTMRGWTGLKKLT